MTSTGISFLLTTLAGMATMIGSLFIFFKQKTNKILAISLSFAAGVMITVSLTDLIPESFSHLSEHYNSVFSVLLLLFGMNIGMVISIILEKIIPKEKAESKNLYRVGIISMLAIIIHNIPEGMATFIATSADQKLGFALTIAIALHNIPEGISISVPIYYATKNKKLAVFYTFVSGVSEPLGALLTYLFLKPYMTLTVMGFLCAIIAGIMLYIGIYELLPTAKKYEKRRGELAFYALLGASVMLLSHILL